MTTKDSRANDEAEIRTLIDDWANALRGKDADGVVAHYTADNSMGGRPQTIVPHRLRKVR